MSQSPSGGWIRVPSALVIHVLATVIERCLNMQQTQRVDPRTWVLARKVLLLRHLAARKVGERSVLAGYTTGIHSRAFASVSRLSRRLLTHESQGLGRLCIDQGDMRTEWQQVKEGGLRQAEVFGHELSERVIRLVGYLMSENADLEQHAVYARLVGWGVLQPFRDTILGTLHEVARKRSRQYRNQLVSYYEAMAGVDVRHRSRRYGAWGALVLQGSLAKCLN